MKKKHMEFLGQMAKTHTQTKMYACYFIQNPKKKSCTPKEMEGFIKKYKESK